MLDFLKKWIRRNRLLYAVSRAIYGSLVLRFADEKGFTRYRLTKVLKMLSALVTREGLVGGLMTDEGDYYLRMPDGILVFYNTVHPQYTPGDGQNLEFKAGAPTPNLEQFVRRHLSNEAVYFDVGANNGYFYCQKVAQTYPRCRIHAFEPDARILGALRKNIAINGAANVTVAPVALSDFSGVGSMPAYLGASGYLMSDPRAAVVVVDVEVTTLDRYAREHGIDRLDLVKVDIEGGEYRFIQGAQETLGTLRPLVVMELRDDLLRRSQASEREVIALWRHLGYVGYRVAATADAIFLPEERSAGLFAANRSWLQPLESARRETIDEGIA